MRTLGNILWLLLAGIWLAIGYALAGILNFIIIIGIPFGVQAFKLAGYALWPFGRVVVRRPGSDTGLSILGNVAWFIFGGWFLVLLHVMAGVLLCLTIIGIPLGIASFKMAGLAVAPFGKQIVPMSSLQEAPIQGQIAGGEIVATVPQLQDATPQLESGEIELTPPALEASGD